MDINELSVGEDCFRKFELLATDQRKSQALKIVLLISLADYEHAHASYTGLSFFPAIPRAAGIKRGRDWTMGEECRRR